MIKGNGEMGVAKHRKSGVTPKSPKQRLSERLRAERLPDKKRIKSKMCGSVKELLKR